MNWVLLGVSGSDKVKSWIANAFWRHPKDHLILFNINSKHMQITLYMNLISFLFYENHRKRYNKTCINEWKKKKINKNTFGCQINQKNRANFMNVYKYLYINFNLNKLIKSQSATLIFYLYALITTTTTIDTTQHKSQMIISFIIALTCLIRVSKSYRQLTPLLLILSPHRFSLAYFCWQHHHQ